jgi:type II secretory pathway component PulK
VALRSEYRRREDSFALFSRLSPLASDFSQRGSTLILVLAILSILILIAATLSYTARLEEISARNFADGIQARMAAQTGLGSFFATTDGRTSSVASLRTDLPTTWTAGTVGTRPLTQMPGAGRMWPERVPFAGPTTASAGRTGPQFSSATNTDPEFARVGNFTPVGTDLVHMRIVDESSKININKLGSWAESMGSDATQGLASALTRASTTNAQTTSATVVPVRPIALGEALYAVLSSPEVKYAGASRQMTYGLARAILRYRYGSDGQPGKAGVDDNARGLAGQQTSAMSPAFASRNLSASASGQWSAGASVSTASPNQSSATDSASVLGLNAVDDADEFEADLRVSPKGDDQPFHQVEDLLHVEGMTKELLQALRPYVTVFSVSERRIGPERDAPGQLDLNVATPVEIYDRLRMAYPGVSAYALAQYAANIVDYRDDDSVPTAVQLEGTSEPILGVEVAPCITEVWAGSSASGRLGDDGEFIEIYNPYDTAISLAGWSLRVVGGGQAGLHGQLVAGGFLIVTNDYNGQNDRTHGSHYRGAGSFYGVFGAVPNGRNHLLIEAPTLMIPNGGGTVELRDAGGRLIDCFRYGGEAAGGLRRSYQRADPRVRTSHVARCTPYALDDTGSGGSAPSVISAAGIKNAPFQSALELLSIGCAFADPQGQGTAVVWQTPTVGGGGNGALDERVVDLFTVWTDGRALEANSQAVADTASSTASLTQTAVTATGAQTSPNAGGSRSVFSECGRINLNTAPAPVLRVLPGLTARQIEYLLARRQNPSRTDAVGEPVVYERLSELLADNEFWGGLDTTMRVARLTNWMGTIAFSSNSYRIISENRAEQPAGPRLASRSKVESLVSTDGGRNQVVVWRFLE